MTQQNYIYNKMNKDGSNSSINALTFDTTFTPLLVSTGQMAWNGDEGTFNASLYEGSVLQLGQEILFYGVAIEDIPNASVVMIAGVQGNRIKFAKATAAAVIANPKVILGVSTSIMTTGGYGYVAQIGNVNDVTTLAGWQPEDVLYFDIENSDLNGNHGLLTKTVPSGAYLKIPLATVILKSDNAPAGRLLVRPDIAYRFEQISNIYLTNLADNDTLRYNEAGGYWFNAQSDVVVGDIPSDLTVNGFIHLAGTNITYTGAGTSFDLINTQVTSLNIGGAATALTLGAPTGTLTLNNPNIIGSNSTQNLFANASTTTLNLGTFATAIIIGAATGSLSLRNPTIKFPGLINAVGDLIYGGNADGTLTKLPKGTAGQFLKMNSGGTAPEWGTVSVPGGLTAGDAAAGFINYNGTTKTAGQWYGGTTAPSNTNRLNYDGVLWATQVYGAVFNDYAEFFIKDEEVEAGDVVVKNPVGEGYIKSKAAYDRKVVGVYSDTFGHILGADPDMSEEENLENYLPIGLAGRVYVKVVGTIKIGDLLVSSNIPGVAMASDEYKPGTIIGKALQSYSANTVGKIRMLIMNA